MVMMSYITTFLLSLLCHLKTKVNAIKDIFIFFLPFIYLERQCMPFFLFLSDVFKNKKAVG